MIFGARIECVARAGEKLSNHVFFFFFFAVGIRTSTGVCYLGLQKRETPWVGRGA